MKYFIIAGEASGDLHASNLIHQLRVQDKEAEFAFLGGDLMQKASGVEPIIHYKRMAFMGVVNVLLNLRTILSNYECCRKAIMEFMPDVLILVDYPSFNLKIAEYVKKNSKIPVHYYISPKLWVWKEWRIKSIRRYVDKMYCILPFEKEFYNKHRYAIEYVGNPTVDSIEEFKRNALTRDEFIKRNGLDEKPIIALLAGSRKQEITKCLPLMIKAAESFDGYQIVVAGAPGVSEDLYAPIIGKHKMVFGQTYDLVNNAYAAVVNSGTATLETALLRTPEVVVYHVIGGRFATLLKHLLIKVKYVSLVNLIANREVVVELIAHKFTLSNLQKELSRLLNENDFRESQQKGYDEVIATLGAEGCAANTARLIISSLKK